MNRSSGSAVRFPVMVKVVSPADMSDRSPVLDRGKRARLGAADGADGHEQVPVAQRGIVVVLTVADGGEQRGLGRGGQGETGAAGAGGDEGVQQSAGVERDRDRVAVQPTWSQTHTYGAGSSSAGATGERVSVSGMRNSFAGGIEVAGAGAGTPGAGARPGSWAARGRAGPLASLMDWQECRVGPGGYMSRLRLACRGGAGWPGQEFMPACLLRSTGPGAALFRRGG